MRARLVLLLIAAGAVAVQAGASRNLLQSTSKCPIANCNDNACVYNSRRQAWSCSSCQAPMVPNQAKTACVCPAGQYPITGAKSDGTSKCALCPKGFFCPRGNVAGVSTARACPKNMDTLAAGAKALTDCVNKPGFMYKKTATGVRADPCGIDTYTPGLAKQTQCTQCPPGFKTNPELVPGSQTSSEVCVAEPGYFVTGDSTAPCPQGEFNDKYDMATSCTPCASLFDDEYSVGITTSGTGTTSSSECRVAEPGYVLVNEKKSAFLARQTGVFKLGGAKPCPQRMFCPGGDIANDLSNGAENLEDDPFTPADLGKDADIGRVKLWTCGIPVACPGNTWTEDEGAKTVDECVARPGWYISTVPTSLAAIVSSKCVSGTYKEEWDRAPGCKTCENPGLRATDATDLNTQTTSDDKWQSDETIYINELDQTTGLVNRQIPVRGSPDSCFIQKGMGTLTVRNGAGSVTLQARICPKDSYGISAAKKYGRSATPCTPCPANMQTVSQMGDASVQITGYDTTSTSALNVDTTTRFTGAGGATNDEGYFGIGACQTKAGFGYYDGAAQKCPKGTYNAGDNTMPCTICPVGTTTDAAAINTARSNCNLLMAGYGNIDLKGVPALCPLGTYSPQDTSISNDCTGCPSNRWTPAIGALASGASDDGIGCTLCAQGYGDDTWDPISGTTSPTCGSCKNGLYGDLARNNPRCQICPIDRVFSYAYNGVPDVVNPQATSPAVAGTVSQCVTDFQQIVDGAFYIPFDTASLPALSAADNVENIQSCVELCRKDDACAAITFNYDANNNPSPCKLYKPTGASSTAAASSGIAWKTMPSTVQAASVAKGMGSGLYSFYYGVADTTIDSSVLVAVVTPTDLGACLDECTNDNLCAGVFYDTGAVATLVNDITADLSGGSCQKILGKVEPGNSLRTLTKTRYGSLQVTYAA